MNEPMKGPPGLQECWEGFRHLLCVIETLFGDLFDGPHFIARREALPAMTWLRDAECAARALLLAMAQTIVATMAIALAPVRACLRKTRAHAPPQSRFVLQTPVRRKSRMRVHLTFTPEWRATRAAQRAEDGYNWRMFARPAANALERIADAPPFLRVETKGDGDRVHIERRVDLAHAFIERRALVRRFNGLVKIFQDPAPSARRLARRLARDRHGATVRALARTPTHPCDRPPPMDAFVRQCHALALPRGADDG